MSDLAPDRLQLMLARVVDVQDQMLAGVEMIFRGLKNSTDPETSLITQEALKTLKSTRDTLEAMIDGLHAIHH